jgi:hypothetical protein
VATRFPVRRSDLLGGQHLAYGTAWNCVSARERRPRRPSFARPALEDTGNSFSCMFVRPLRVGTNNVICSCFLRGNTPGHGVRPDPIRKKGTYGGGPAGVERTRSAGSRGYAARSLDHVSHHASRPASTLEVMLDGQACSVVTRARADAPVSRPGVGRRLAWVIVTHDHTVIAAQVLVQHRIGRTGPARRA